MTARASGIVALAAVALLALTAVAAANPPRPVDPTIAGGDGGWRADNSFSLSWAVPPVEGAPLAATHYRVRDPQGATIAESHLAWVADGIGPLIVPKVPGAYSAEVWFEDLAGAQGPAVVVALRFDDTRPGTIQPPPVPAWIGRGAFPLRIRLDHPSGPAPLSGIRGYAVSIDPEPSRPPCAAADRCTDIETTLRGGVEADVLAVGALPAGTHYLRAVAVSGSGMKSAASGLAVLRVDLTDPVTQVAGAPDGWTNRPVWLTAGATDAGAGMQRIGNGAQPFTAIQVEGGAPAIGLGASVTTSVFTEGAHRVAHYARDAAGNLSDGAPGNAAPATTWVRIDRTPPAAAFTNSQDPADPDLLRVRIYDPLSGPDGARGWIGVRAAGSGDRFEPLPSAPPAQGELRARWASDEYPAGEFEFRAIAHDAAGNAAATARRADGKRMVLSNPLKATTDLHAAFRRGTLNRTVRFGRGVLVGGRLTTGIATPLRSRPLRVVERFADGARPPVRTTTVWTGGDGAFSLRAGPGPSRTIAIGFEGGPTLTSASGRTLRLDVRGRVVLRASSAEARVGGAPIVFAGQVSSAAGEIPPGGKSVQLQFRLPGLTWEEFRTVQTDRRGRFRYAYRFSDDDSRGVRFQFRAYAPAQEDWPYEPAGSRPVLVRGR